MAELQIRKVRPDELTEVWRVPVAASNDPMVRRGRPATRTGGRPGGERCSSGASGGSGALLRRLLISLVVVSQW